MKKALLVLLILLAATAYAEEETVKLQKSLLFDGWVYENNITKAGTKEFQATLGYDNRVSIKIFNESTIIISNNSCKTVDFYEACFYGTQFGYHDYKWDKDVSQLNIKLYMITTSLDITRDISAYKLLVGDKTTITTSLWNTGTRTAENVVFNDIFPDAVRIEDISGCEASGNTVYWSSDLGPNARKSCTYVLRAISNLTFNSKANLTYSYEDQKQYLESNQVRIEISEPQLRIDNTLNKSYENNEPIILGIALRNINTDQKITLSEFSFSLPDGLWVRNLPREFTGTKNFYKYSGLLGPNESVSFSLNISGNYSEPYNLTEKAVFFLNNKRRYYTKKVYLNISFRDLEFSFNTTNISDDEIYLRFDAANPSSLNSFRDIKVKAESNYPSFSYDRSVPLIAANRNYTLINRFIKLPRSPVNNISLNITVDYLGSGSHTRTFSYSIPLSTVEKPETAVETRPNMTESNETEKTKLVSLSETKKVLKTYQIYIILGIIAAAIAMFFISTKKKHKLFRPEEKEDSEILNIEDFERRL